MTSKPISERHVLSVHEPWASRLVLGQKREEYRSWRTRYRGRLLIHSVDQGAIIGHVELWGVRELADVWAWRVRNAKLYKRPIPAKGQLGVWRFKGGKA